ncbi:MAG: hypothetical protein K0M40_22705 [Prolixibacteraceae bacterium]|nr:hypothetical protein [Prolixibacteraceae bacterium]
MTQEFKPILIGKHTDRIESQTASWMRAIYALNSFAASWNTYFNETLDLNELAIIFNQPDLTRYIKEKFVRKNPKHLDFMENLNIKIEKLLEMVIFPDFDHLLKLAAEAMASIYPDPASAFNKFKIAQPVKKTIEAITESAFELWKEKLFDGTNFEFTDELKNSIVEENSVYTRNQRENAAFIFYTKFSELLNVFNNMGHGLETRDFPIHFHRCLNMANTEKIRAELKVCTGEKHHPIRHFYPAIDMFRPDWNITMYFENLTDDQVNDLINKYS